MSATGRAPIVKMSRRMPPTPVAAPWNGSMKVGWLCDSTLKTAARAVADVHRAGVFPRSLDHPGRLGGEAGEMAARGLVGAVLRPHGGEHPEFGRVGGSAEQRADLPELLGREPGSERRFQRGGAAHDSVNRWRLSKRRRPSTPPSASS